MNAQPMNPYFATALIGLVLKIWAGYRLHLHWRTDPGRIWLLLFLAIAYLQTIAETIGYIAFPNGTEQTVTTIMHCYYLAVTAMIIIFPFSVATAVQKVITPLFVIVGIVLYALFIYALLETDLIVKGYQRFFYLATRIPGDFYWVFQSMALITLLLCTSLLVQSYRSSNNEIIKIKSANLLIGFIPLLVVISPIVIAMRMGVSINAAGVLPFLISIYIVVLAENLRDDRLVDLRAYLPWTRKARLLRRLAAPMRRAGLNHEEIRELAELYRRTLEHQNRQVRLSRAAEAAPAAPVAEFDPAQAPRR